MRHLKQAIVVVLFALSLFGIVAMGRIVCHPAAPAARMDAAIAPKVLSTAVRPATIGARRRFAPTDLWLIDAPDRARWQKPDLIMDALNVGEGDKVADIGAGGGWFTVRLARRVRPTGSVYAQDIQPTMLRAIDLMVQRERLHNVQTVLGTSTDPKLPRCLDAVLIVDAYHEMDERPQVILALLRNIAAALKPDGRLGIVDFLPGDGGPGPAAEARIDAQLVTRTVEAAGMRLRSNESIPPFEFLLVFDKPAADSDD